MSSKILYQGSQNKFDEYDISKIGSADTVESFGYGIYFADNEELAKYYGKYVYEFKVFGIEDFLNWEETISQELFDKVESKLRQIGKQSDADQMREDLDSYGDFWSVESLYGWLKAIFDSSKKTSIFLYGLGVNGIIGEDIDGRGYVYNCFSNDNMKMIGLISEGVKMETIREAEDFINGHIGRVLKESEDQEDYLNFYKCSECDERWMKSGASKDNDICPVCNKETISYDSKIIDDEELEESKTYKLFFIGKDGKKKFFKTGLKYIDAWEGINKYSKEYNTEVRYQEEDGREEVKESVMVSKSLDWMEENYLEEAQEINMFGNDIYKLMDDIADLTDINDHNGSVMALAQFLKAGKSIKIMKAIKELHNIYGSMPSQLIELRSFELKELLKQVAQKYGEEMVVKVKEQF